LSLEYINSIHEEKNKKGPENVLKNTTFIDGCREHIPIDENLYSFHGIFSQIT
jgi:hypothetical protein